MGSKFKLSACFRWSPPILYSAHIDVSLGNFNNLHYSKGIWFNNSLLITKPCGHGFPKCMVITKNNCATQLVHPANSCTRQFAYEFFLIERYSYIKKSMLGAQVLKSVHPAAKM